MTSTIRRNPTPATTFGIALMCTCFELIILLGMGCSAFSFQPRRSLLSIPILPSPGTTNRSMRPCRGLPMSSLDRGWDNDNFLDSLGSGGNAGGGNEALERANDEYYRQSRYGRPAAVDTEEERGGASSPPTGNTRPSYKESLKQRQQQRQQQTQQQRSPTPRPESDPPQSNNNDMAAVSDAAAEIYSYSYNKDVDAPPALDTLSSTTTTTMDIATNPTDTDDEATTEEATLPKDMVDKAKASHGDPKEEASQGGSKFQELMDRAREQQKAQQLKQQQQQRQQQQQQQQQEQHLESRCKEDSLHVATTLSNANNAFDVDTDVIVNQMAMEDLRGLTKRILQIAKDSNGERILSELKSFIGVDVTPPSRIMTPEEIANLSVEEQARLYREFFYVQQKKMAGTEPSSTPNQDSAPKSIGSTSSNYLEPGIGFDGRKIGRNKDADSISNASDVYFAQLKRDSTTRNLARYSGDNTKANDVFHDPSIRDIQAPVNPYLQEERKRMRDVLETVPEEMLIFSEFDDPEGQLTKEEMKSFSGVSYKDKLLQKKREREEQRKRDQQDNNNNNNNNNNNFGGNGFSY